MSFEVGTGFEPVLTDLQSVASPLGQPTVEVRLSLRADDEARTRDLNLGKVALYLLSYSRVPDKKVSDFTTPGFTARMAARFARTMEHRSRDACTAHVVKH